MLHARRVRSRLGRKRKNRLFFGPAIYRNSEIGLFLLILSSGASISTEVFRSNFRLDRFVFKRSIESREYLRYIIEL